MLIWLLLIIPRDEGSTIIALLLLVLLTIVISGLDQSHEVFILHKFTILINNSHSCNIVLGIDLVHQDSHDNIPLPVFDVLLDEFLTPTLIVIIVRISVFISLGSLGSEGTSHQKLLVILLALVDHKSLCLFLELFSDLFDNLNVVRIIVLVDFSQKTFDKSL